MNFFRNMKIGRKLYGVFSIIIVLVATLVAVAYVNLASLGKANRMNVHTYQVTEQVGDILTALVNIETGERGFALTGQDKFLEPLNAGKSDFSKDGRRRSASPRTTRNSRSA